MIRHTCISVSTRWTAIGSMLLAAVFFLTASVPAQAHDANLPIAGKKTNLKTNKGPQKQSFMFRATDQPNINIIHDPAQVGMELLVMGMGENGGRTSLITLDPALWKVIGKNGNIKGYKYKDKEGTRGGVKQVILKPGMVKILAKGSNWDFAPTGAQDGLWVQLKVEDETWCSYFDGAAAKKNESGRFTASKADAPLTCLTPVCGNGEVELGEDCDDGNLTETDGCTNVCTIGECEAETFATTWEAIQSVVFDGYDCTNSFCHGAAASGGLDLTSVDAYDQLIHAASQNSVLKRVEPGEPPLSYLYEKLAAKTLGIQTTGTPMPSGGIPALTLSHLEGMEKWIRGGSPQDLVVAGTAQKFGTCLPEADPLKIPVPDPPALNAGVQVQQTAWDLPSQFEDEVCMATYFDFEAAGLIPESAVVPCPSRYVFKGKCDHDDSINCTVDADCGGGNTCIGTRNVNNYSEECFAIHTDTLWQDPQSHHSIIHVYTGASGPLDDFNGNREFGPWTYKTNDPTDPKNGQPCDPFDIDPNLGWNPDCSGQVVSEVACLGYGPPDYSTGGFVPGDGDGGTGPTVGGSQEPFVYNELFPGVYTRWPKTAVMVWNSHAFNLTSSDTTMAQYFNLTFAGPQDQLWPALGIFDSQEIFVQNVPPFEAREYCSSYTAPQDAYVFDLGSHTHQWGVRFRIWAPPNTPCVFGDPACVPDDGTAPIYFSTDYTDPVDLDLDPPMILDSPNAADRTFLFCSLYDNGSTAASPPVKQQSTSPEPPTVFGLPLAPGGPCNNNQVACMDGPNKGVKCGGNDAFCDSSPGAADGSCDACPVRGGVTTMDEMFIMLGKFYCPNGC